MTILKILNNSYKMKFKIQVQMNNLNYNINLFGRD